MYMQKKEQIMINHKLRKDSLRRKLRKDSLKSNKIEKISSVRGQKKVARQYRQKKHIQRHHN